MTTIFPLSASVNQEFNGYRFDGNKWEIIGIDLTADYLEQSSASITYLDKISASTTYTTFDYVDGEISNIDLSPYLTQSSASSTYATINYVDTELSNIDTLPSQIGNDGKFLSTNGSAAYWGIMPSNIVRHAWSSPYDYIGVAPYGTAESSSGWTLTRITVANNGTTTVEHASDSWNNRATAVYS